MNNTVISDTKKQPSFCLFISIYYLQTISKYQSPTAPFNTFAYPTYSQSPYLPDYKNRKVFPCYFYACFSQ